MAPMDIPGYYWDDEKKRYFKIEKNYTAPAGAPWSAKRVKLRASLAAEQVERRPWQPDPERPDIGHTAIYDHPSTLGRLAREQGDTSPRDIADLPRVSFAKKLVHKGYHLLQRQVSHGSASSIPHFYVSGEDTKTGVGVVYWSRSREDHVSSAYVVRDDQDNLVHPYRPPWSTQRSFHAGDEHVLYNDPTIKFQQISSMNYHSGCHKLFITTRDPRTVGFWIHSPEMSDGSNGQPLFLLSAARQGGGATTRFIQTIPSPSIHQTAKGALTSTMAPPGSSALIAAIGTKSGILQVGRDETPCWLGRPSPLNTVGSSVCHSEVLALDFLPGAGDSVMVAGTRGGRVAVADRRTGPPSWGVFDHGAAVGHVRALSAARVLVAGAAHRMRLYDLRMAKGSVGGRAPGDVSARALVAFDGYRNAERVDGVGWDAHAELGVVAAAHGDDGAVVLFSVSSGRRLAAPALETAMREGGLEGPVPRLQFQSLPGDKQTSLFATYGGKLHKFSLDATAPDDPEEGGA